MPEHAKYTEADLDLLINQKLKECSDLPYICKMIETEAGKNRIVTRVKEVLFNDGIANIDAALVQIEDELTFE